VYDFNKCFLSLLCLMAFSTMGFAEITADQLKLVEKLSPQDKTALVQEYKAKSTNDNQVVSVNFPQIVQSRQVGTGVLERDIAVSSADAKLMNQDVSSSFYLDVSAEQVQGGQGAEKNELKQAFVDFVRE